MTVTGKINYLKDIKANIRRAIAEKGVDIGADTPLKDYPEKVSEIKGGSGEGMSPSDCADLNLYLAGDWDGHVLATNSTQNTFGFASRPLKSFSMPDKNYSIGAYFFSYCKDLTSVSLPLYTQLDNYTFDGCSALEEVELPKLQVIPQYCFRNCSALTSASFPSVQTVGQYAFVNCGKLEEIDLPNAKTIDTYAFCNCVKLKGLDLPEVTSIGTYAFTNGVGISGIFEIRTINAPKVTTIGSYAFNHCEYVEEINFPALTTTSSSTFGNMKGLKKATFLGITGNFGNTSNSGSSTPFPYCPNLKVVDVGEGVTSVRYLTYYSATDPSTGRIENLIVRKTTPPTLYNYACMNPVTNIYVPDEAVDAYKAATNWSNTAVVSKIKPLSEYVEEVEA